MAWELYYTLDWQLLGLTLKYAVLRSCHRLALESCRHEDWLRSLDCCAGCGWDGSDRGGGAVPVQINYLKK